MLTIVDRVNVCRICSAVASIRVQHVKEVQPKDGWSQFEPDGPAEWYCQRHGCVNGKPRTGRTRFLNAYGCDWCGKIVYAYKPPPPCNCPKR